MIDRYLEGAARSAPVDWNVRQALAWLRWRNEGRVAEYAGHEGANQARRDLLYDYDYSAYTAAAGDSDARRRSVARGSLFQHMSAEAAAAALLAALRCGKCQLFRNGEIVSTLFWRDENARVSSRTAGMIAAEQVCALTADLEAEWWRRDKGQRVAMEARRRRWINRFLDRQLASRTWIGCAEIADAIAREPHPEESEDAARARAYAELADVLRTGVGEAADRYVRGDCGGVLHLNPSARFQVLTAELFDVVSFRTFADLRGLHLAHCYAHRALASLWRERGHIRIPGAVLAPAVTQGTSPAINNWMLNTVNEAMMAGSPLKRDDALARCQGSMRCTYRDALAAWTALPVELRRPRGRPRS